MKKSFLLIICAATVLQLFAQESLPDSIQTTNTATSNINIQGSLTDSLVYHTRLTAQHTEPTPWGKTDTDDYIALIVSRIAVILSAVTIIFEVRTARRTQKTAENIDDQTKPNQTKPNQTAKDRYGRPKRNIERPHTAFV